MGPSTLVGFYPIRVAEADFIGSNLRTDKIGIVRYPLQTVDRWHLREQMIQTKKMKGGPIGQRGPPADEDASRELSGKSLRKLG